MFGFIIAVLGTTLLVSIVVLLVHFLVGLSSTNVIIGLLVLLVHMQLIDNVKKR